MKAKQISQALKIYKRVMAAEARVAEIIGELDDMYASRHVLATITGLDSLTVKCHIASNPNVSNSLLLWVAEHLLQDIRAGTICPDESKQGLLLAINRAMLKRRVANYVVKKLTVAEGPDRFATTFSSMELFRSSGLVGDGNSCTWTGTLPPFQVEAVAFLSKVFTTSDTICKLMTDAVAKEPATQAEVFLNSAAFTQSGLYDLSSALAAHNDWTRPKPAEPTPTPPPQPDVVTAKEKEDPEPEVVPMEDEAGLFGR